ncbi:MAG: hypothetical protein AAF085_04435, partial [Planctomycetota bacterium]
ACSSGEEPYTLAMILHRSLGIRLADWKIEILGPSIHVRLNSRMEMNTRILKYPHSCCYINRLRDRK